MEYSINYSIPLLAVNQDNPEATHNYAVVALDILSQIIVQNQGELVEPVGAAQGAGYIVASGGSWESGDPEANGNDIAIYYNNAWFYYTPKVGWMAYSIDDSTYIKFNGTTWGIGVVDGVTGPGTTIDRNIPIFDGNTGSVLADTSIFIDANSNLYGHLSKQVNIGTSTYTVLAADTGKVLACTVASTITLLNTGLSTDIGFQLAVVNRSSGVITISPGTETLESKGSLVAISAGGAATVLKHAATTWGLYGDLE